MANSAKNKGDEGERELVRALQRLVPHRCVDNPMRMLGAGRKDDIGDIRALDDVAIQVKAYAASRLGAGINESVVGADRQAKHAGARYALGVARVEGARVDGSQVRWIAVVRDWPTEVNPFRHRSAVDAADWIRQQGVDRRDAVILVERPGAKPFIMASLETWLAAWETAIGPVQLEAAA